MCVQYLSGPIVVDRTGTGDAQVVEECVEFLDAECFQDQMLGSEVLLLRLRRPPMLDYFVIDRIEDNEPPGLGQ